MIDIAMTAAIRPDVLTRTLESVLQNIAYDGDLRLIVDVAPVGDVDYFTQEDVVTAIRLVWPHKLITRTYPVSLQAEALRWTWAKSTADWVLQWEDDWLLLRPVKLECLCAVSSGFGMVYLDRQGKSVLSYKGHQRRGKFKQVSDSVYERCLEKSLGGPPAILARKYVDAVVAILDGRTCLDVFSRTKVAEELLADWRIGVYLGEDGTGNLVKDIGKQWRQERGLQMVKRTKDGVKWIKTSH